MSRGGRIALGLLGAAALIGGMLFFNSAFYYGWAASGPPADRPELLQHFSRLHSGYSFALILLGGMLLYAAAKARNLLRLPLAWLALAIMAGLALYEPVEARLAIKACLKDAGTWVEARFICEPAPKEFE